MFPVQKLKNIMILINLMIECDEHLFFSLKPTGVTKSFAALNRNTVSILTDFGK